MIKSFKHKGLESFFYDGSMKGILWAVKVSGNWRVVFCFQNGDADHVDYRDYH